MVMIAFPLVFIGITVSPFGVIGRWTSLALFIVANLLLWGAMVLGFYHNVYIPWRNGESTPTDHISTSRNDKTSGEP